MKRWLLAVGDWFDARLRLSSTLLPVMRHPIPREVAGPMGWWYVFGSASLTLLLVQILTGIGLALVYVPSADKAYDSLLSLNYDVTLGWFLRALHYYAGSGMVVLVLVHATQVFLHGAYKYPRELTWVLGVFLLLCTLGMFFSGQVLRWDPDAYWGLAVGGSMAGRVPVIGPWVVRTLLGGPVIGGDSLSRFFALHVFAIPGALLLFLAVHLWLVLTRGVSAPPVPGEAVDPKTYDEAYEKQLESGVPFLGDAMMKDALFSAHGRDRGGGASGRPRAEGADGAARPHAARRQPPARVAVPVAVRLAVAQPPRGGDLHHPRVPTDPHRRPVPRAVREQPGRTCTQPPAGGRARRDRDLHGPRRAHLPGSHLALVAADDRLERRPGPRGPRTEQHAVAAPGAALFQSKDCRNCHALEGTGGRRGPDLTTVGTRLTPGQLIDQISNGTPGGGNMPAYGKQISPAEMTALVEFLADLRPAGQPRARLAATRDDEKEYP